MDETLFYVFGLGLVVSAVAVSAVGLRFEGFPPSRAALAALIAYFVGMVAATTTFAVLNARDQQHERQAKEAEQAAAQPPAGGTNTATSATTTPAAGKATTLKLAADPSAIAYDTTQLSGSAGKVTIDFTNPSALTHDVCITSSSGQQIGCSPTISQDSTSLTEDLKPGNYTFFCSVDGHEAAGMKGTLKVS
ncbi:MAG: plastocyanin/azurin family copper-binding protein [Solirubrobacterales bacterium]